LLIAGALQKASVFFSDHELCPEKRIVCGKFSLPKAGESAGELPLLFVSPPDPYTE